MQRREKGACVKVSFLATLSGVFSGFCPGVRNQQIRKSVLLFLNSHTEIKGAKHLPQSRVPNWQPLLICFLYLLQCFKFNYLPQFKTLRHFVYNPRFVASFERTPRSGKEQSSRYIFQLRDGLSHVYSLHFAYFIHLLSVITVCQEEICYA